MSMKSVAKHLLHCSAMFSFILFSMILEIRNSNKDVDYGTVPNLLLLQIPSYFIVLLAIPIKLVLFLGLVCFNAFPDKVVIKDPTKVTPFVCVRIVTRGMFPELVVENAQRNLKTCLETGLDRFVVEVVTDKSVGLPNYPRLREIVVPPNYKTKNGTLFKARALQYCLEDGNNTLLDEDWVVHLDEESIMTPDSVRGIINFVNENKHQLGQGLITYGNGRVANWLTNLLDFNKVATDVGIIGFQLRALHKIIFTWKGSYMVIKAEVEKIITFDHGPSGSITEDVNFGLLATARGYTYDFIHGEIWESLPFSVHDFVEQRCRWITGYALVVHNKNIPYKDRCFAWYCHWCFVLGHVFIPVFILNRIFTVPYGLWFKLAFGFMTGVNRYNYVYGMLKSFSLSRLGVLNYIGCILLSFHVLPLINYLLEIIALVKSFYNKKLQFFIVQK